MSLRELRPRTPRITGAFAASKHAATATAAADTSKLAVRKRGGPKKFDAPPSGKPALQGVNKENVSPGDTSSVASAPEDTTSASSEKLPAEDRAAKNEVDENGAIKDEAAEDGPGGTPLSSSSAKKPKTKTPPKKKDKLKYPPGTTPYPDHPHPTPADCLEVAALLTAAHGPAVRPETVPQPDNDVSGCGEVPSVLDALARTVLSANTSNLNSSRAFKGLLERFGMVPHEEEEEEEEEEEDNGDGGVGVGERRIRRAQRIGRGSVDWTNVRRAPMKEVVEAIRTGGMAVVKARHIKDILEVAWEEGRKRRGGEGVKMEGVKTEDHDTDEHEDLSLEYLRDLSDDEVMSKLMSFDGVGCKTASCVAMFCLGRPKFPVDTHVWRISKYLSWTPEKATREDAYHHLDTRIPDELKYSLHCLLIRHGRTCRHCRAGPQTAAPAQAAGTKKRARVKEEGQEEEGEAKGKRMRVKKVWVGTGMMKEVVVEVPEEGVEEGDADTEHSVEACVLEGLIKRRVRKVRA